MLNILPTELIIRCLEEINQIISLLACRLICRRLRDIIDQTDAIRYIILLARYGLRDVVTKRSMPLLDRMKILEKYVAAWRDPRLSPARTQLGTLLESYGRTYELQSGLFVRGRPTYGGTPWYSRELCYTELPWRDWCAEGEPIHSLEQENEWSTKDLGMNIHDFQVDPSQDLVVLVQRHEVTPTGSSLFVHIKTISDNLPHPESSCPVFPVPLPLPKADHVMAVHWLTIQIMDDLVGLLSCWREWEGLESPHELVLTNSDFCLFNWKTGVRHALLEDIGIDSMVFLDQETVMFARRVRSGANTASLDVYRFSQDCVVPLIDTRGQDFPLPSQGVQILASFSLPSMTDTLGGGINRIITRCEPSLSYRSTPDRRPPQMKSPPPTFHPTSRLIFIGFSTHRYPWHSPFDRHFNILLLSEDLARLASATGPIAPREIAWKHWGPRWTRCLEYPVASRWICYAYGTRFARLDFSGMAPKVWILDFDRDGVRGYARDAITLIGSSHGNTIEVVKTGNTNHGWTTWIDDIVTYLPYRQCTIKVDEDTTGVMIDSERLILSVHGEDILTTRFRIYNV